MENTQIIEKTKEFEELYKTVMNLYWTFLSKAEEIVQQIPESETETLQQINTAVQEVLSAMEHDINLFEGAVAKDQEEVKRIKENLEIQNIHKKLNA